MYQLPASASETSYFNDQLELIQLAHHQHSELPDSVMAVVRSSYKGTWKIPSDVVRGGKY